MAGSLRAALLICLLQVLRSTADVDSGSFLIYNQDHNKCIVVESASSVTVTTCDPRDVQQQFRWASESRLLSLSQKLCLGASQLTNWVKVLLFPCDEKNELQHWHCKNETLFGLKDRDLHLNWGNKNEPSVMVYHGVGLWSRWKMYGTQGDLCSKGYQEIFTIGGNAYGSPCQFPFLFGKVWYAECITDGRSDGQFWCATETDYDTDQKWGFCPVKSSSGWDRDPVTGVQYQRNVQAALTWHQARRSCQQQGADLLSIVELHEQAYISGLTNTLGTSLWIGLNSLDYESGWQWSNGSPFRYLNWGPGQPSSVPGHSCVVLNAGKASKWESQACAKKLGYMCRRGNSTSLPPAPPPDQPIFCPSNWVPYAGSCYYLERSKRTWSDAMAACHREEGDLASIHNIEEQSFVISQLGYAPADELWIGLNDQRSQMLFEWTDRSRVTFTRWQTGEPSHATNHNEDCVLIRGKDGKWADQLCEKTSGYICKKRGSTRPSPGQHLVVNPGCEPGWVRFGSYCYNIGDKTETFDDAKRACEASGAHLVDVANRYENAFLVSLVGLRPEKYFWTGLSNMADVHTFKWTTPGDVKFTNFNAGMPDRKQGCVAVTTGVFAGLWDVVSCADKEKYICEKRAEGVATTREPPTTPALSCPPGWNPVDNRSLCSKLFTRQADQKKTWAEAREFCKAIGGDLMSIHSLLDLDGWVRSSQPAWIGLSSLDTSSGFTWTDGSPLDYEGWGFGEPNNHNHNEYCAEVTLYYDRYWNDRHCDAYSNWLCQIHKGVTPKPEPTPVVKVYNTTQDGWILYNGTQYFINMESLAMDDARAFCKKNFGDLVAFTGESERKFIWKQISRGTKGQYYIGLMVNLDKSFSWLDGSPVAYTAWEQNEPNFANNDENCVTIYKSMGYWNDINCGVELPSICKRSTAFTNTTVAPTAVPRGGCAPEWNAFQGKCYKVVSGTDKKSWHDARTDCLNLGGNLVSILNEREQAFLTTKMLSNPEDLWIGMNDINREMRFLWTEGRGVSYTNWAKGHPTSVPDGRYSFMDEVFDCVVMVGSFSKQTGLWKVEDCGSKRGFICKRNLDTQVGVPPTSALPRAFYKLGNDSYQLVTQKMRWGEARRQCQADDADLASVLNPITQAYILLHTHNEPVWIGLNSNVTGGRFRWVDNWPLSYTKWGENEPKINQACVYIDVDKKWKTAPCTHNYYSLCKKSPDVAPSDPPQLPGKCPESKKRKNWLPFRGHCYAFSSDVDNWAHASVQCLRMGGSLVSIEDPVEGNFIQHTIELLQDSSRSFWVGLLKSHEDEWKWIDNSVLDYTNWQDEASQSSSCVEIRSDTGRWRTTSCSRYLAYICKTPKLIIPTEKAPVPDASVKEEPHGFAGVTVAVVLVIIAALGLAVFFLRKRIPAPALGERTFENSLYFNHPVRAAVDTKGLVANIEQNELA